MSARFQPARFRCVASLVLALSVAPGSAQGAATDSKQNTTSRASSVHAFVEQHCASCHDRDTSKGNLDLISLNGSDPAGRPEVWEKVARRLQTRQMPPPDKKRPDERAYESVLRTLETSLDSAAAAKPNPGRTATLRRLNRTEYRNAIRDLLALDIDAVALLPGEDASHGFDNVAVGDLSPTLLNRYITAAEKVSRLAIGTPQRAPGGDTFRLPPDRTQEEHVDGLPSGTRGGTLLSYTFPRDGEYDIQIRLTRDRNEHVEGLREPHQLEVLLDRQPVKSFTVVPPKGTDHDNVDAHLKVRVPVTAGPHQIGVTFVKNPSSLLENRRQPYLARYNMHRHPRLGPAIYQVSINGPYNSESPGDSPSRRRIFVSYPSLSPLKAEKGGSIQNASRDENREPNHPSPSIPLPVEGRGKTEALNEDVHAEQILMPLMRRAYRRPVNAADLEKPMAFYREAKRSAGFDAGIEAALSAVLVNPEFLFRIEADPENAAPGTAYRVSDIALASRLSFFLWSSIPDDELLAAAERGELHRPAVLEKQVRRMLADERANNLVRNFGEQWLHLRNLESLTPDLRLFPEFDDNLRQAFRRETELHFERVLREDRSVLELLRTDHAFLNERLAKHYGIPHVYGSRFRRVSLDRNSERGGLLRQGSVLAVTSYATRTSPVLRGKWILENIIGTPPPPPLPDVPALDNVVAANLSVRERLAQHRANAACASCHNMMDPPGFALEHYDAVGRWRALEEGRPVDASGGLPDGSQFTGVAALEDGLVQRPEVFVRTLTEKLLTFALGRGVEHYDAPAVRKIVREAKQEDYRLSAIVLGITKSVPFTMRRAE